MRRISTRSTKPCAVLFVALLCCLCGCKEKATPPGVPIEMASAPVASANTDSGAGTLHADELIPLNAPIVHYQPAPKATGANAAREVEWLDLMSSSDRKRLEQGDLPIPHDGAEAAFTQGMKSRQAPGFSAVHTFDHQRVKLAGYYVPLEQTDAGELLEVLFVPYYGACIHVPPPPANQIIYAKLKNPSTESSMYDAYWLEGTLVAKAHSNGLAETGYTMMDAELTPWQ